MSSGQKLGLTFIPAPPSATGAASTLAHSCSSMSFNIVSSKSVEYPQIKYCMLLGNNSLETCLSVQLL